MTEKFKPNWYPFWSPRFWHGMRVSDYLSLLWRNRLAVHPARFPLLCSVGGLSVVNSFWAAAQRLIFQRKIRQTAIQRPPIFIIGHWRTGTTLLHELLTSDPQFAFASNYDCFAPHHFLLTKPLFAPIIHRLLPHRRPMDDMALGAYLPQEDEFALCALGAPTPYWRIAFPNRPPPDLDLLNLDSADARKVARFRAALEFFFQSLTCCYGGKQLVLKSPPHTGRIRQLSQWFPGAKFIHLSRRPFQVFGSTLRLWRATDEVQGFQIARYSERQLQDFVISTLNRMYEGYFSQRAAIPPENLLELKFEELVADPLQTIRRIYEQFELPGFDDQLQRRVAENLESRKDYQAHPARLDAVTENRIIREWGEYFEAFGYETSTQKAADGSLCASGSHLGQEWDCLPRAKGEL